MIKRIFITILAALFFSFLWWLGGFDFNSRGIATLIYIATTILISFSIYDATEGI